MTSTGGVFKPPRVPATGGGSRKKTDKPKIQLGAIPETTVDASLPDPMALDKDGYVDKNIMKQKDKSLSHMSNMCPGLHGKETRQEISRATFNQLFTNHNRFVIPIFQRRYCWKQEQVERWFDDCRRGSRDPMGSHNTGNLVITRLSEGSDDFVLIDGQQRVTTTLILISVLKDFLLNFTCPQSATNTKLADEKLSLLNKMLSYLHVGSTSEASLSNDSTDSHDVIMTDNAGHDVMTELANKNGNDRLKLQACYLDRESFSRIMVGNPDLESYQGRTYQVFKECLEKEMETVEDPWDKVEMIREVLHQGLDLMSVTMVKIVNCSDPAQVFLWLQERSFFNGYMLQNLRPGEFFTCADLVRNLVLAPLIKLPDIQQDRFYLDCWLTMLENRFQDSQQLNTNIVKYIEAKRPHIELMSEFEVTFTKMFNQMNQGDRFLGLYQYSKFVTIYEATNEKVSEGGLTPDPPGEEDLPEDLKTSLQVIKDIEKFFILVHDQAS